MKYILYSIITAIASLQSQVFADGGVLWWLWSDDKIRRWDIHLEDIAPIIKYAIDWVMRFAGTVAVIAIIIGAYKILFGSVSEWDTKKGKEYIGAALMGFAIAALSWFFVKLIIDNFS